MINAVIQYGFYLAVLVILAIPFGTYIKKIMDEDDTLLSKFLDPCERAVFRIMRLDGEEQMTWKKYAVSVMVFSGIGLFLFLLPQVLQGMLTGNLQQNFGMPWQLSNNMAVSFVINIGLTVQNFLWTATGIAVLFALVRGITKVKTTGLGSFWVDLIRINIHILIPLNLVLALCLAAGGVIQTLKPVEEVSLLEPIAISEENKIIEKAVIDLEKNMVTVDGKEISNAEIVTSQFVPMGPVASQIASKQSGANSVHPFENPNAFTNLIEMIAILLIPAALYFAFGESIRNRKQGTVFFSAMFICLILALIIIAFNEQMPMPHLAQDGAVNLSMVDQAGGNMEGKESRFGIASSATWTAFSATASGGSVNSVHDSYTPLGGMVSLLLVQFGNVVFGGVGHGLYKLFALAVLIMFVAGRIVGRTPEFLGKRIESHELKWSVLVCLGTPVTILVGNGITEMVPQTTGGITFCLGLIMLFAGFVPIIGTLAIAGGLVQKEKEAVTAGTICTCNVMFVFLLALIVLLVGVVSFFPTFALEPLSGFIKALV